MSRSESVLGAKRPYPHNDAGIRMREAEKDLRKSVEMGILQGERARQAIADADMLFNMRLKWG